MPLVGEHGPPVLLLELDCADPECRATFVMCTHCYRGHSYCGSECRDRSRARQRRAANARYQATQKGRRRHAHRERRYRYRCRRKNKVTDPTSLAPVPQASSLHDDAPPLALPPPSLPPAQHAPPAPPAPPVVRRQATGIPIRWRCCVCRRAGVPLPAWLLYVGRFYHWLRHRDTS